MSGQGPDRRRQPHWFVLLVVGVLIGLPLTWLGVNDWRVPWASKSTSTAPVRANVLDGGAVDISWSLVDRDDIDHYAVIVIAVAPLEASYGVPHYSGVRQASERIYPASELNEIFQQEGRAERVDVGQRWYVCVTAMLETPLNEPIGPYVLADTRSCSPEFSVP